MTGRIRTVTVLGTVLALTGVLGGVSADAAAAQQPPCQNASQLVQCGGGGGDGDGDGGGDGGGGGGVSISVDFELYFDDDGTGVDSEEGYETGCWGIQVVPEGQGGTWEEAVAEQEAQGENGVLWGNCEVEDTIDPAALAQQLWQRQVRPPPPTPLAVQPGKALAGLRAYLEIGGEVPARQTIGTPIGPATFVMTPRYVISWGDGETTTTSSQGGPYPDGDITHVYRDAGPITITVDAYWRTTWTLAGQSGDLPELAVPTSGALDLVIEERQAVGS